MFFERFCAYITENMNAPDVPPLRFHLVLFAVGLVFFTIAALVVSVLVWTDWFFFIFFALILGFVVYAFGFLFALLISSINA